MKTRAGYLIKPSLVALTLAAGGCGTSEIDSPTSHASGDASAEGEGTSFDHLVTPPKGYYDALFHSAVNGAEQSLSLTDATQILWINFDGATVAKGFGLSQSFIPCKASTTIAAPSLSPADKQQIISLVQQFYDDAGATLIVTPGKPASGDFTTIHVGGSYRDLGCLAGSGILGVAPFDVGNVNRNDVGFAFMPSSASARLIAETIAHEAGHSFGLEHVVEKSDLMFASAGANIAGFGVSKVAGSAKLQDAPAILQQVLGVGSSGGIVVVPPTNSGSQLPVPALPGLPNIPTNLAGLPGLAQLGTLAQLIPGLQAGSVVDISQLLPQIVALLPVVAGTAGVPGLDQVLTILVAAQTGTTPAAPGVPVPGVGTIPIDPALLSLILTGATGVPVDVNAILAVASTLSAGSASNVPNLPALTTLPDLTQLLNLGGGAVPDLATLIASFTGSTQVINANFSGTTQDALLSLLKVAYAQQYAALAANLAP